MKISVIFPAGSISLFDEKKQTTFGGAGVQMYLIAKELAAYPGIKTYSFVQNDFKDGPVVERENFTIVKTFKKQSNLFTKIKTFHDKLREIKPDVVIQHGLTLFSCLLALYCKVLGIKFVFMFAHDLEVVGKYQSTSKKAYLFHILLKYSHRLITQNNYQKQTLLRRYKSNSTIIRNGFEIGEKKGDKSGDILWVARCEKWKNPKVFIELAERNPEHRFIMICPPAKDEVFHKLIEKQSKEIDNLEFITYVPFNKIERYFTRAKLFINTSLHEGFPQTFIQAAAASTPIISLSVNPDNIIDTYDIGFHCANDFDILNEKINLLTADTRLYRRYSDNAYNYAINHHNIKKTIRELLTIVEK